MSANEKTFDVAVLPGDGIGIEVMESALAVLRAAEEKVGGFKLDCNTLPAGALHYRDHGVAMPDASWAACDKADAILLGAIGWPEVRYPDGTEIITQVELRIRLGLYGGVRPIRHIAGRTPVLSDPRAKDIDFVLVRESTEGLFAGMTTGEVIDDSIAHDRMTITRDVSERLFDLSFRLAQKRKGQGYPGRLTLVDKANIFRSMAFFRKVFDERAANFPDIATERLYVDACALDLVRRPWDFDVMVTENMFGDILSDLGAGLIGGMGFAPSADIGDNNAVFQPSHGTAPDIAGTGKANPTAMILSAALMLDWLAERHDAPACAAAAKAIDDAMVAALAEGRITPYDRGGEDGTWAITEAVVKLLQDG
ncbi:MAG: isocitrate/isopropylmalate family dehydrogenase [Alphaproteobacteria bacterium]